MRWTYKSGLKIQLYSWETYKRWKQIEERDLLPPAYKWKIMLPTDRYRETILFYTWIHIHCLSQGIQIKKALWDGWSVLHRNQTNRNLIKRRREGKGLRSLSIRIYVNPFLLKILFGLINVLQKELKVRCLYIFQS